MLKCIIPLIVAVIGFPVPAQAGPAVNLRCSPIVSAGYMGNDPIVTIIVSVSGGDWHVTHIAQSGSRYDRAQQYSLRDASSESELAWSGTLQDRPFLAMSGRIISGGGAVSYVETLYNMQKNGAVVANVRSNCVPLADTHSEPAPGSYPAGSIAISLSASGGVFVVPVLINRAITLSFIVDSGAADVAIPADVVLTLLRTGTITNDDFLGDETYRTADGRTIPSKTFRIRSLKVGTREVNDVIGSISPVEGELLLGQTFLKNFRSWSIDNENQTLVLN